jgi:NAD-dependent dihydropyrimidine dehydrogenase PreA subunit
VRKYTISDECIYCGSCEPACPFRAIAEDPSGGVYAIDPARCTGCPGSDPPPCVDACPIEAVVLRPPTPSPPSSHLRRARGTLLAPGGGRLLLAELTLSRPPDPDVVLRHRAGCELELAQGVRVRLHGEETAVLAPVREARGPWIAVASSPLAEALAAAERPGTPHGYLALRGPALTAGERVVVVGELAEQTFLESGGFREPPRALPRALRALYVAADEPESLALLERELDARGIGLVDL